MLLVGEQKQMRVKKKTQKTRIEILWFLDRQNKSLPTTAAAAATAAHQANTAAKQGLKELRTETSSSSSSAAALCTHLGINIGVKGPTAFELFLVYRALGGRNKKKEDSPMVLVQMRNEQTDDDHK